MPILMHHQINVSSLCDTPLRHLTAAAASAFFRQSSTLIPQDYSGHTTRHLEPRQGRGGQSKIVQLTRCPVGQNNPPYEPSTPRKQGTTATCRNAANNMIADNGSTALVFVIKSFRFSSEIEMQHKEHRG